MNGFDTKDIDIKNKGALISLVREALDDPTLTEAQVWDRGRRWDSHQTLHILFGAEQIFGVEFTSEQMERVEGVEGLLAEIDASLAASAVTS
jgi:hypothetical protein